MKIWAISDLQRDLNRKNGFFIPENHVDADVCVIAGDFHPPLHMSIAALSKISFQMPVIYVAGNRDFYGYGLDEMMELAKHAANAPQGKGIHVLHDESVVIDDTRFIGATLWTDLALREPTTDETYERLDKAISDFYFIHDWSPRAQVAAHLKSRAFIEAELAKPFDGPTVVVSHHSPHPKSISKIYADDEQGHNCLFHSNLSAIMEGPDAPDLWIHGATHCNADYLVGNTKVISNSQGYTHHGIENPFFQPDLVIEVEKTLAPTP